MVNTCPSRRPSPPPTRDPGRLRGLQRRLTSSALDEVHLEIAPGQPEGVFVTAQQSSEVNSQPIGYWAGESYRRIAAAIRQSLAEEGLTQPQWWMLNHVAKGEWSQAALLDKLAPINANEQGLDLVHELDGLIERGWLTREPATEQLTLTPEGEAGRRQTWDRNGATHRGMIAGVSGPEYDACITVLQRIVGNLGGDPSPH